MVVIPYKKKKNVLVRRLNEPRSMVILVPILERYLIPLYQQWVIVKLLTSQLILQTIHLLAMTLFLHLILV